MATAYLLSSGANKGRFDVTVYQMGHRLGGKCAITRGPGGRIQEHGVHMLFGFYHNTFAMLRDLYKEVEPLLPEDYPIKTLMQAYLEKNDAAMAQEFTDIPWTRWDYGLPVHSKDPRKEDAPPFDKSNLWLNMYLLIRLGFTQLKYIFKTKVEPLKEKHSALYDTTWPILNRVGDLLQKILSGSSDNDLFNWLERAEITVVQGLLNGIGGAIVASGLIWLIRLYEAAQLGLALIHGYLVEKPKTWQDLDKWDFHDFLQHYGMPKSLEWCSLVGVVYLAAFSFDNFERTKGSLSCGAALNMTFNTLLYYRGSWAYYFAAGCADIMITPI